MGRPRLNLKPDTLLQSIGVGVVLAVLTRSIGFGRSVLLARVLAPSELGTWALAISAIDVLAFALAMGIPSGLSRYVEQHRQAGSLFHFLRTAWVRTLTAAGLICLIGLTFSDLVGRGIYGEVSTYPLAMVTLVTVLSVVVLEMARGTLHGLRLFRLDSLLQLMHGILSLGLAGVLLFLWTSAAIAAIWAHLIGTMLALSVTLVLVIHTVRVNRSGATDATGPADEDETDETPVAARWNTLLFYSLATWGAGTFQVLTHSLDRYMLLHLSSSDTSETLGMIGGYFIAGRLAQPLAAVIGIISVILLPHAVRLWEAGKPEEVGSLVRLIVKTAGLSMTLCGAALIVLRPYVLTILIGYVPQSASQVLPLVLVTTAAMSSYFLISVYIQCRERVWLLATLWGMAMICNVVLNVLWIPTLGLIGAARATTVSVQLTMLATLYLNAREGMRLDLGTCLCCFLPLTLLLPEAILLATLATSVLLTWFTPWILTSDEKSRINTWFQAKFPQYFCVRRGNAASRG